jgi:hypothetical protein
MLLTPLALDASPPYMRLLCLQLRWLIIRKSPRLIRPIAVLYMFRPFKSFCTCFNLFLFICRLTRLESLTPLPETAPSQFPRLPHFKHSGACIIRLVFRRTASNDGLPSPYPLPLSQQNTLAVQLTDSLDFRNPMVLNWAMIPRCHILVYNHCQ